MEVDEFGWAHDEVVLEGTCDTRYLDLWSQEINGWKVTVRRESEEWIRADRQKIGITKLMQWEVYFDEQLIHKQKGDNPDFCMMAAEKWATENDSVEFKLKDKSW